MSKKTTTKKSRDFTSVIRAGYLVMFCSSLAISAYLGILVASPDTGQFVLAGFSAINAAYFFTKVIK